MFGIHRSNVNSLTIYSWPGRGRWKIWENMTKLGKNLGSISLKLWLNSWYCVKKSIFYDRLNIWQFYLSVGTIVIRKPLNVLGQTTDDCVSCLGFIFKRLRFIRLFFWFLHAFHCNSWNARLVKFFLVLLWIFKLSIMEFDKFFRLMLNIIYIISLQAHGYSQMV